VVVVVGTCFISHHHTHTHTHTLTTCPSLLFGWLTISLTRRELSLGLCCWLAEAQISKHSQGPNRRLLSFICCLYCKATTKKSTIEKKKLKDFAYCIMKHIQT